MSDSSRRRVHRRHGITVGAAVTLVGAVVTVVYLFQPWRSCPYDDSPAACAMLPVDAAILAGALAATLIGLVIVGVSLLVSPAEDPQR